jgi:hypothetical protein
MIVVPDRDAPGQKLVDQATEFGWGVAFPEWDKAVGDVADAVLTIWQTVYYTINTENNRDKQIENRFKEKDVWLVFT